MLSQDLIAIRIGMDSVRHKMKHIILVMSVQDVGIIQINYFHSVFLRQLADHIRKLILGNQVGMLGFQIILKAVGDNFP